MRLFSRFAVMLVLLSLSIYSNGCFEFKAISLRIMPNPVSVRVGNSFELTAIGKNANGNEKEVAVQWDIIGEQICTLSPLTAKRTVLVAINEGQTAVRAVYGKISAITNVSILPSQILKKIVISPQATSVVHGDSCEFIAKGYDQYDEVMSLNPNWLVLGDIGVLSPEVGPITYFYAQSIGDGRISCTQSDIIGYSDVKVIKAPSALSRVDIIPASCDAFQGDQVEFKAIAYDQYNEIISTPISWAINGDIGVISPAQGDITTFTAISIGTGSINAYSGEFVAEAPISVSEKQLLKRIEIVPLLHTFSTWDSRDYYAYGIDQWGSVMEITPNWLLTGEIGILDKSYGRQVTFTPIKNGEGTLTAYVDDISISLSIVVNAPVPTTLDVVVGHQNGTIEHFMPIGADYQLFAYVYDQFGNLMNGLSLDWEVIGGIGTLSQCIDFGVQHIAVFHSTAVGPGIINAKIGDLCDSYEITVDYPVLEEMHISPSECILRIGEEIKLEVVACVDQFGYQFYFTDEPTWTVTEGIGYFWKEIGTVTWFHAMAEGYGTITATYGDISCTISLTSLYSAIPVLSRIEITSNLSRVRNNSTRYICAVGYDQYGHEFDFYDITDREWSVEGVGGTFRNKEGFYLITGDDRDYCNEFTTDGAGNGIIHLRAGIVSCSREISVQNPTLSEIMLYESSIVRTANIYNDSRQYPVGVFLYIDQFGNPLFEDFDSKVCWSVNGNIGTLSSQTGKITSLLPGKYPGLGSITASVGDVSAVCNVQLVEPVVTSIRVYEEESLTAIIGESCRFDVHFYDQFDWFMSGFSDYVDWSVSGGIGVFENPRGYIHSCGAYNYLETTCVGTGSVIADYKGLRGTLPFTVEQDVSIPFLASLEISPANWTMNSQTNSFSAIGLDQYGKPIDCDIVWSISGTTIATISTTTGNVTTLKISAGTASNKTATLRVQSGDISTTTTVTIPKSVLTTVEILPGYDVIMKVGDSKTFDVYTYDQYGYAIASTRDWDILGGIGNIESSSNDAAVFTATTPGV